MIAKILNMPRKLVKVLSVVMTALSLFPLLGADIAAEGAYAATAAAFASYSSSEHLALQGVSYSEGRDIFPTLISFSRSDISTYPMSFQFFSSGTEAEAFYKLLVPEYIMERLSAVPVGEGDLIVDGTVRFTWLSEEGPEHYAMLTDFTGARVSVSVSLVVTGRLAGDGVVLEGDVILTGGRGRTVSVAPGSTIMIDGETIGVDPTVFTIAVFGGNNGQMQRIS